MLKLFYHGGSYNHGCEAIVRATKKIMDKDIYLYSLNDKEDREFKLDEICSLFDDSRRKVPVKSLKYLKQAVYFKLTKSDYMSIKNMHEDFFSTVTKDDICISIGGDNYCYKCNDILGFYNKIIHKKGAKTVLWGCSVEPSNIDKATKADLEKYDLITARESISYEALKKINPNTYLFPDPAFQLDIIEKPLPIGFEENNTVGINVSPLIMSYENNDGITQKNYIKLVDYIINNTDMQVALIPHVVKPNNDDRTALQPLYDKYKDTGRVVFIEDCNCMELKGYIKRCRFVVTARTHASIAAYSTCVPTLVVGYSVKAKGIAKDIFGTYENYVLPVQSLNNEESLTDSFKWFVENEKSIKSHLDDMMPEYCAKALKAGDKVRALSD